MTRLLPQGLAGRFALLLVAALLAVHLVALVLLSSERQRLDRAVREGRELERVVALVPLFEAVAPSERARIIDLADDRFSRVWLDDEPAVETPAMDPRSAAFARRIAAAIGPDVPELRVDLFDTRSRGQGRGRTKEFLSVSLLLTDAEGPGQWLNIAARPAPPPPRTDPRPLLFGLLLSLFAVLAVGLLFIRRLTRPLAALAEAARAAGHGDRTARVPERGARELRETARAFNEMQARIARFDAERTRTLAAVGHDLRTPITSLRIRAEMLDDPDREPIVRTLDEMGVMADGLVAYARGHGDAEAPETLDLAALVSRLSAERGVTCAAPSSVHVRGRPVALRRTIGNLVDNAVRYGRSAHARISTEGGEAVVTIEDDGPGIPPERIATMFEPFVRGEGSRSLETGGAGLGLSIARAIARSHGGDVVLRNRPAGGLAATLRLPLAR